MLLNNKWQRLLIEELRFGGSAGLTCNLKVPHRPIERELLIDRIRCGQRRLRFGLLLGGHVSYADLRDLLDFADDLTRVIPFLAALAEDLKPAFFVGVCSSPP